MDFGLSYVSPSPTQEEDEEESQPPLKVFVPQLQNSACSSTSYFPIRALPSIDSDFQVSSSCSNVDVSSSDDQFDGFVSGDEDFEIEISNEMGFSDSLPVKILMPPKAMVSVEDDDDEGFVREDGFSGVVRVSTVVVGGWEECDDNIVARVLSSDREEENEEDEYDDDEDGVAGIDFMVNCKINDEISSNATLGTNTGKNVLGIVNEEELLIELDSIKIAENEGLGSDTEEMLFENIPVLDLVVEDVSVISEGRSLVGVQEQEVIESKIVVKEEKINESLGVDKCGNVDCLNGGDSVLDIVGVEETEVSDVPVGKDMVLLIQSDVVNRVVKELVESNSGCMNVSSMSEDVPFVEVKKMCLPGLDTSHKEENELSEKKAAEVLVKTSMRLGIQSDQELFDVDGCFDSKSMETDFGQGNRFVDDTKSVQNLEHIVTSPAMEILEQANFATDEKDGCEKNCGGFVGSISMHLENSGDSVIVQRDELKDPVCCYTLRHASVLRSILEPKVKQDSEDEGSISDEDAEVVKCDDGNENFEEIVRESVQGSSVNYHLGVESSRDQSHKNNGHMAMEFDKEADMNEVGDKQDLFDPSMLAALPNAASNLSHSGNIGMTSSVSSIISSVGLGSSISSLQPLPSPRPIQSNCVVSEIKLGKELEESFTGEAKKRLEMIQLMRVKFLRVLQRLVHSPEDPIAEQVLHQLFIANGRRMSQILRLETASTVMQLDAEGKDDLNSSLNILVLGKAEVGKSATINSLFVEEKTRIDAFEPATTAVKEIIGTVHGVMIRVLDTPGLRTSVMEQPFNRKVLLSVKKFMKKCPPDIVLYVDRLDIQTRDLNDIPLLRSITDTLGLPIWASVILTLTHAASDPPDGSFGSALSYEAFVAHRSLVVQHSIGRAVGELHMMIPVSLVENHCLGRRKEDRKVLPNDQNWSAKLLLMCYSMKILYELNSLSKPKHGEVAVETTKDNKEFNIHLDSSIAAKHGEDGSTLAGFNIQTFLDKNVATGLKVENQISIGKKLVMVGSTGGVRSWGDVVCGANLEALLKENDYPIGQDQSTFPLSLVKWRSGLEFWTNLQSQFSVGQSSKIAVGFGLNKHSSQITIRTSSSDQVQIALVGVLSIVIAIFRSIWPGNGEKHSS